MIKIGIIGMGRMGITHFSIINSREDVKITAVADTSSLIPSLMGKYLKGIKTFKDYKDLLGSKEVDAILVCTPPNLHFPIVKLAAAKGIHVFCEKPFTTKLEEGIELARLFNEKNLIGQVGYVNRFNDVFVKAKELIDQGVIGNVLRFKSEMFSCTVTKPDDGSGWRGNRDLGGGVVFEMAAHAIDLVNYLVGKPDKVSGASLNKIFSKNVEDAVSSTFLYKNGSSGTIYVNWSDESYRKPTNKIEIFGTEGKLLADQHSIKIYLRKKNDLYNLREGWNTLFITDIFRSVPFYVRGNEFTSQLYEFVDRIQSKEGKGLCTFNNGVETLEVIDAIFNDFELNSKI